MEFLNRQFKLEERGTTVRQEIIAGIATFLTMAYIIIVNPLILKDAGMDFGAVFTATILAAVIGTTIMGLWANWPVAMAPGTEYLKVVEGCTGLIDLQGEVGALLVDDRVLGISQMLVVEVGDDLVPDEFDRHDIPFARLEILGAFAVAHGKPWTPVVLRGLDEKVIPANVDDRVVVAGCTSN